MQFDGPSVIEALSEEWAWILPPINQVLAVSSMGNVFVECNDQSYWRVCPEELTAETVARTSEELDALYSSTEYKKDWEMANLVTDLIESYGDPLIGECFGLTIPAVLSGEYSIDNIRRRGLYEHLRFTGDVARQTKDLKDGDILKFEWV